MIVGASKEGVYAQTSNLRVEFIYYREIEEHKAVSKIKQEFEENWPLTWKAIKETLPPGPIIPYTPQPQKGLIGEGADLYLLTIADFLLSGTLSRTMAEKLLKEIRESKTRPLDKVLNALGIKDIGEGTSKLLSKYYSSLDTLGKAPPEELSTIPGLGATRIVSLFTWFHCEENWRTVEKLRLGGVDYAFGYQPEEETVVMREHKYIGVETGRIQTPVPSIMEVSKTDIHWRPDSKMTPVRTEIPPWDKPNPVEGKVFMFTGKLTLFTRDQAQKLVEEKGGVAGSSVTKSTDYLVVGEKPGSKLVQATLLKVPTLTEKEFLTLVS